MKAEDIAEEARRKILAALRGLRGTPGSVSLTIHCDSTGPRKVVVNTEEAIRLDDPPRA